MGDKSTPWERAWRSARTCTVFRHRNTAGLDMDEEIDRNME